ncbi:MAG: dihydroneopterin aldolase [Thermoleophilia bacterium]|jgi:dihydroneopterin aldolase|nr:dihydroneopterin aldolase [Thermoleophilia bacterium]
MSDDVWIELRALRVLARIGVSDSELEVERPLLIDLDLIPRDAKATETDAIADTIDYSEIAALAESLATAEPHRTLERLAAKIADAILAGGACAEVGVRVAKPEPPMEQRVDHVAVRVARSEA